MAYEQRDNSGSVFKNERKTQDTHPDRTGSAMIEGVAYWVNGWIKQDRNGNQYLSLSFKRKEQKPQQTIPATRYTPVSSGGTPVRRSLKDDMNDEIPFAPEWR